MDRLRKYSLCLMGILLFPAALQAEIKIQKIDASRFPHMEATVELQSLKSSEGKPTFVVYEDYGSGPTAQNLQSVEASHENSTNWVVVLDATKSVPKKDFLDSRKAALDFLKKLPDTDRVAIYRINGKPVQILSMTTLAHHRPEVLDAVSGIERTGMKTRIYDALYVGLDHAVKASQIHRARGSALILFTDGKDEGSYLSEEDAIQIAGQAREARIPVFTILNGAAKGEKRFQKIALKTGGEVFARKFPEKKLQPSSESVDRFVIRYDSKAEVWEGYPGKKIQLQVEYLNEGEKTSDKYEVPFQLFGGEGSIVAWILLALGLFLLVAFFVFLWVLLRRASVRRALGPVSEEVMQGWKPDDSGAAREESKGRPAIPEPQQVTDFTEALARSQNPSTAPAVAVSHAPVEASEPATPLDAEEEIRAFSAPEMPFHRRTPETISLELKEKSYQVLQMALRDAPRYETAMIVLVGGDPYRQRNEYDLFLDETYIGRSPMASLVVADKSASMLHGKIRRIDQRFVLFDLVSDAGTFLNGKRVLRPRPLRNGDEIQVGHTRFEFRGKPVA